MVIGSDGRIGKELVERLNEKRVTLSIKEVIEYTTTVKRRHPEEFFEDVDFIYYLESVDKPGVRKTGLPCSYEFASRLLLYLQENNNPCPIVLKSSEKAMTEDGYLDKEGRADFVAEELFFQHGEKLNAPIMIYRLPKSGFLKDHMDELIEELMSAFEGKPHRCNYRDSAVEECEDGRYCYVPIE